MTATTMQYVSDRSSIFNTKWWLLIDSLATYHVYSNAECSKIISLARVCSALARPVSLDRVLSVCVSL